MLYNVPLCKGGGRQAGLKDAVWLGKVPSSENRHSLAQAKLLECLASITSVNFGREHPDAWVWFLQIPTYPYLAWIGSYQLMSVV